MKRREPMEFPLLEVIAFPAEACPVSVMLAADFELTGEVHISMGVTEEHLENISRLLKHITENIADELWLRRHVKAPPFKVTGESTTEGAQTE